MPRQLAHIALSVLLLVATSGISVKKHYCMGMLRYATLAVWQPPCCGENSEMPEGCCQDEYQHFQVQEDFQALSGLVLASPAESLVAPFESPGHSPPKWNSAVQPQYLNYRPPLLTYDIPVRVQVFLI